MAKLTYGGGKGSSLEDAIVIIDAPTYVRGVGAKYTWIETKYGARGTDWTFVMQGLMERDGRRYDQIDIVLASGEAKSIHFDISHLPPIPFSG